MYLTYPRRCLIVSVFFFLVAAQTSLAAERSWNKIRYQGGTIQVKVNPFDWNTTLEISPDHIELNFESRKRVVIRAQDVTALSHGNLAYRRVFTLLARGGDMSPIPLFGILHSDSNHFVGMEFRNPDGSPGAVLLLVHKESYGQVLQSLSELTGRTVEGGP